jgi:hypothetical protein
VSKLSDIMASTGMTREQIRRAVATGYGRFNPDTYARRPEEADTRLANLFTAMRETRRMLQPGIETEEQAGELRRLIQKHAPIGETRYLRDSWDNPASVQIMPDGRVEYDSECPYARIQDLGGTIFRVSSKGKAYKIEIPAQHYVQAAINEYNAEHASEANLRQGEVSIFDLVARGAAILGAFQAVSKLYGS